MIVYTKIKWIEGLRGIAAIAVILHHLLLAFYPAHYSGVGTDSKFSTTFPLDVYYQQSPFGFLTNGNFMVCLFFTISGYVLSLPYFSKNNISFLLRGMSKRFIRLYLPVLFSTIVSILLIESNWLFHKELRQITHSFWLYDLWNQKMQMIDYLRLIVYEVMFQGKSQLNTVYWTISIELIGSYLIYGFLLVTHRLKFKILLLGALVVPTIYISESYITFLFGAILSFCSLRISKIPKSLQFPLGTIFFILGLFLGGVPSNGIYDTTFYEILPPIRTKVSAHFFHSLGAASLLTGIVLLPNIQNFFIS